MAGLGGRMYGWTDLGHFSSFYSTLLSGELWAIIQMTQKPGFNCRNAIDKNTNDSKETYYLAHKKHIR